MKNINRKTYTQEEIIDAMQQAREELLIVLQWNDRDVLEAIMSQYLKEKK